jgi:hypothetical protein
MLDLPDNVSWCMNRHRHLWWLLLWQWWRRRRWRGRMLLVVIYLLHLLLGRTPVFLPVAIGNCHAWYDILPLPCRHSPGRRWLRAAVQQEYPPVCQNAPCLEQVTFLAPLLQLTQRRHHTHIVEWHKSPSKHISCNQLLPSSLFPSGFLTETQYAFLSVPNGATCPAHLTVLHLTNPTISREQSSFLSLRHLSKEDARVRGPHDTFLWRGLVGTTPELEDNHPLAVQDCLSNICAVSLHIWGPSLTFTMRGHATGRRCTWNASPPKSILVKTSKCSHYQFSSYLKLINKHLRQMALFANRGVNWGWPKCTLESSWIRFRNLFLRISGSTRCEIWGSHRKCHGECGLLGRALHVCQTAKWQTPQDRNCTCTVK